MITTLRSMGNCAVRSVFLCRFAVKIRFTW